MATLYLFPDTNLFIQCRPLGDLDWSLWPGVSEIHLIVSLPVRQEIDAQKKRGNDRIGRRARKTSSLFRQVITSESRHKVIRDSAPLVTLHFDEARKPGEELADILDYGQADGLLLGHMHAYMKQYPERPVRLLTHDTGPMGTAQSLGLPFTPIPDSWLREPEETEAEKENRKLREEVRRLQSGPQFEVAFVNTEGDDVPQIEGTQRVYVPLSNAEREALMAASRKRLPRNHRFDPLTSGAYGEWLEKCEEVFANLHRELQIQKRGVSFAIRVHNAGTSPGKDTLLRIAVEGGLRVLPLRAEEDLRSERMEWRRTLPPVPPPQSALLQGLTVPRSLTWLQDPPTPRPRDPHDFYYASGRPEYPQQAYALECMQWRHRAGAEHFEGEIFAEHGAAEVHGALECTIHADNLASPTRATVPVRIAVEEVSTLDSAKALVAGIEKGR